MVAVNRIGNVVYIQGNFGLDVAIGTTAVTVGHLDFPTAPLDTNITQIYTSNGGVILLEVHTNGDVKVLGYTNDPNNYGGARFTMAVPLADS